MECPYLGGLELHRVCNASLTLMTPGANDIETYCETEDHYRCPMLLSRLLMGGAVPCNA